MCSNVWVHVCVCVCVCVWVIKTEKQRQWDKEKEIERDSLQLCKAKIDIYTPRDNMDHKTEIWIC